MIIEHKKYKAFYYSHRVLQKLLNIIPDSLYLRIIFFLQTGRKLNLRSPKTYNEKIQWLKLFDRKKRYSKYADKVFAKETAGKLIGPEYIIPTLGVWNSISEVDFEVLPDKFVLKCTHDSGSNYICSDKAKIDYDKLSNFFTKRLSTNYYWYLREWQYKDVIPRIIAEPFIGIDNIPDDFKFFCFDGIPKLLMVVKIIDGKRYSRFFDMHLAPLQLEIGNPIFEGQIELPENINEMFALARKLSIGFSHIRIDLYNINGAIYFGEYTFHHWSGMAYISPKQWDIELGNWIDINLKN